MAMLAERLNRRPDEALKRAVWDKGRIIGGFPPEDWRWDTYGYVIRYADFGNRGSRYGWEIDHFHDAIRSGGDPLMELRPLNCCSSADPGRAEAREPVRHAPRR